jgi:hypothetical protein
MNQTQRGLALSIGGPRAFDRNIFDSQRDSKRDKLSYRLRWASKVVGRVEVSASPNSLSRGD